MPRHLFKRFAFKRHDVARQWFMTPFRHLLHDPRLWAVRRRWVVPAFALGLFVAFMPFPGHTFVNIWQPMLLGSILLGAAAALLGYVILDLLWRSSIANYKTRKRGQRSDSG